jgi:pSer/pThr/pTyr-binding forkhead associated (FHA) protein
MNQPDFTTWLGTGSYGGLAFSVLAAAGIAVFALRLRRGTPRQLARAILVCLFACCLSFAPIWWEQTRFDLLGPTLAPAEIGFWLGWVALCAWGVPLGTAAGYLLLAAPQPATGRVAVPESLRAPLQVLGIGPHPVELRDPRRSGEPLGPGRAWGQLTPLQGPFAGRPVPLTHGVVLIGRESDCDLIVDDELASRHHAEVRWEHGHIALVDRGSMNGTRVNGQGVAGQAPLHAGDIVEIGDQRFRFDPRASGPGGSGVRAPLVERAGKTGDPDATRKVAGAGRRSQPSLPLAPALRLVVVAGPEPGRGWDLTAPLTMVGRDPASDICLPDHSVSRQHAQIVRQASGFYAQDLGSENGTRLDGQELTGPAALRPGALLALGDVALRCEVMATSTPAAPELGAGPATPLPASATTAAPTIAWGTPTMHHLMAPNVEERDRPRLGPPRLFPDQPEQAR